jgi:hypothetical protein
LPEPASPPVELLERGWSDDVKRKLQATLLAFGFHLKHPLWRGEEIGEGTESLPAA